MPREKIHWEVLSRTLDTLAPDSVFRKVIVRSLPLAQLGAILPDAPYYLQRGRSEEATKVAEFLHGRAGEDTFAPLREWATQITTPNSTQVTPTWALWAGVLSHLVTDQIFHPMVFWFTGDYYAPESGERSRARTRHRLLEVYLDSHISNEKLPLHIIDLLRQTTHELSEALPSFVNAVQISRNVPSDTHALALWHKSIAELALLQRRFLGRSWGIPLRILAFLTHAARYKEADSLFRWRRTKLHPTLLERLTYRNPVDGVEESKYIEELLDAASLLTARYLKHAEHTLGANSSDSILPEHAGVSLSYGRWKARAEDARYFSAEGLPIPGLRR